MAWHTETYIHSAGSISTVLTDLLDFIENVCGWTLHDDISASEKVFYSEGSSGDLARGYIHVYADATYIHMTPFCFWDDSTHTGAGQADDYYEKVGANDGGVFRFYGDENLIGVVTPHYRYFQFFVGHFGTGGNLIDIAEAETTGSVSAGSNVVIPVDNTDYFRTGTDAIILDSSTGTRQPVSIVGISEGASLTVATLSYSFEIGSRIGWLPMRFGYCQSYSYVNRVYNTIGAIAGTGDASSSDILILTEMFPVHEPAAISDLYTVSPTTVYYNKALGEAFYDTHIRIADSPVRSIFVVNDNGKYIINTATGGSTTDLDDSSKTWTTNEHAGKSVVIVAGTGVNQSRIIASNTATKLVFRDAMEIAPVSGSNYIIADKTYLMLADPIAVLENEEA